MREAAELTWNFTMCVMGYYGAWKLFMHKGGHSFVAYFKSPEMPDLSETSGGARVTQVLSASCPSGHRADVLWQFSECLAGLAGFLFHMGHTFLVSYTAWGEICGNAGHHMGHGIFSWLLFSSVGRYCVHLFLFLLHFNERTILIQNAALEVSWLHLSPVTYWLCFFIIFYSTDFRKLF